MATIKMDKVLVFKAGAPNALKAANEIDNVSYTYTDVHESVVVVTFASKESWKYSEPGKQAKEVEKILKKYCIDFCYKKF